MSTTRYCDVCGEDFDSEAAEMIEAADTSQAYEAADGSNVVLDLEVIVKSEERDVCLLCQVDHIGNVHERLKAASEEA